MQVGSKELLTAAGPALVAEVLQRFGAARIQVAGTSMLPAIRPRDVLHVEPRPLQNIRIADIVLFTLNNRLFAHRVVRTGVDDAGSPMLVTRGDTHRDEDQPIASHQVLGQVLTVWRNGRAHQAPFAYSRAGSLAWRAAAFCLQIASRLRGRGVPKMAAADRAALRPSSTES
ncbi:MAG TPA: S24/S26 family peptidase [Vicinamibacterales bacterium]|nr:S24/S26 family peptidase [Vicinamibacterales bacterium]